MRDAHCLQMCVLVFCNIVQAHLGHAKNAYAVLTEPLCGVRCEDSRKMIFCRPVQILPEGPAKGGQWRGAGCEDHGVQSTAIARCTSDCGGGFGQLEQPPGSESRTHPTLNLEGLVSKGILETLEGSRL